MVCEMAQLECNISSEKNALKNKSKLEVKVPSNTERLCSSAGWWKRDRGVLSVPVHYKAGLIKLSKVP